MPSGGGGNNLGGLAGLASQFGVNVPTVASVDLSSPSLFPELLRSRTFAEKILDKKFYTKEFGKELSLLAILTHGNDPPEVGRDTLVTSALSSLGEILTFDQDPPNTFSVIKVTASEPLFAKELAEVTLAELEALNRFYKSQAVNEKTSFISNRISSVENDLESSEKRLKEFNERNRQISSPALQLEHGRLARDVEIQKGIYLTLKQQFELAKIEEIQGASIVQILDKPQVPLGPSNIKLKLSVMLAGVLGVGLGILLGFIRSYLNNSDMDERKKLRRTKHFFKKKIKDIFQDRRVSGIVSLLLLIGLPFYLGYESKNPVFFGMYSAKLMLVNTVYVLLFLSSSVLFIYLTRKKTKL
uniref:Lipopolysaccharide biosynthesis protein n=1 Tax=uncultured marine thaumarchaeote KM3_87_H02 TaxID=1456331 RepID=A0A075HW28_9ARCH|nr:lipopolysaccharide biosynthesis protein [uncultured marine thaumarchaeote KM3_87_H02]